MRYGIMLALLFVSLPALAQNVPVAPAAQKDKGVLIRSIEMNGLVLGDKEEFIKLFKPFRNKYMTTEDMDGLLRQVQLIYEREGYKELVTINYQVVKRRLVFTVLMTS